MLFAAARAALVIYRGVSAVGGGFKILILRLLHPLVPELGDIRIALLRFERRVFERSGVGVLSLFRAGRVCRLRDGNGCLFFLEMIAALTLAFALCGAGPVLASAQSFPAICRLSE